MQQNVNIAEKLPYQLLRVFPHEHGAQPRYLTNLDYCILPVRLLRQLVDSFKICFLTTKVGKFHSCYSEVGQHILCKG